MVFTTAHKVTKHLGYFVKKIVIKKFQKSPNLVTLMEAQFKQWSGPDLTRHSISSYLHFSLQIFNCLLPN